MSTIKPFDFFLARLERVVRHRALAQLALELPDKPDLDGFLSHLKRTDPERYETFRARLDEIAGHEAMLIIFRETDYEGDPDED